MTENSWMKDPSLADIDSRKLDFMQKMFIESKSLSKKEMMPFFMALAMKSKKENIQFTEDETNRIIAVLKANSTPEELKKMDFVMKKWGKN
ncbi:MAG: hypothetical protein GX234_08930 [Clostridiales bacterium]|nr:hypothetical protein [Clostridiales bacterium]